VSDLVTANGHLMYTSGGHLSNVCPVSIASGFLFYGQDLSSLLKRTGGFSVPTNSWLALSNAYSFARRYTASFAIDQFVYGLGGDGGAFLTNSSVVYDTTTDVWSNNGGMGITAHMNMAGFRLNGDGYAMTGARNYAFLGSSDNQRWTLLSGVWDSRTAVPSPLRGACAHFGISDEAFIVGGRGQVPFPFFSTFDDVDRYTEGSNSWSSRTSFPAGTTVLQPGIALNSRGYVFGGGYLGTATKTTYEFIPGTNSWNTLDDGPDPARNSGAVFSYLNKGYVTGGRAGFGGIYLADNYEYDPDIWTAKTDVPIGLGSHSARSLE